jgi:molybdopterin converting factor small subunit
MGMPRQYAACDTIDADAQTLNEALRTVAARFPEIQQHCFDGETLRTGFLVGVNSRFDSVRPAMPLQDGDTVQLLSADVGGH